MIFSIMTYCCFFSESIFSFIFTAFKESNAFSSIFPGLLISRMGVLLLVLVVAMVVLGISFSFYAFSYVHLH